MLTPFGPYEYVPQTGTRARGHSYERAVQRHVSSLVDHLGWTLYPHYWVGSGDIWLQPDFIIQTPSCAVVLEAKLTFVNCNRQLRKYTQLVSAELNLPTWGAQVCRNLTRFAPKHICTDFWDLEPDCVWHLFL